MMNGEREFPGECLHHLWSWGREKMAATGGGLLRAGDETIGWI